MKATPLLALLALGLGACASQANLAAEYLATREQMLAAAALTDCAPSDRALLEANLAFTELEFDQGSTDRAEQHLDEARKHLLIVQGCPAVPRPQPKVEPKPEPKAVPKPEPVVVDTDRDGIPDPEDRCPKDPEDLDGFKDGDGCAEMDNDLDGVADFMDRCPNDAEDQDGFADTDGCADPDNDEDGLVDAQDKCPLEKGTLAEGGCPVYDKDKDGIADTFDACVDQPENLNQYLDEDGCPDTKPQRIEITADAIVIKQRINFASGKAIILKDSFVVLDDVAQVLRDYPKLKVEIGGHTDNKGDDNLNLKLSKKRSDAVFQYLVSKGVVASRLVAQGYGEARPVDTNMTDIGRQTNRRVEFILITDLDAKPAGASPVAPAR